MLFILNPQKKIGQLANAFRLVPRIEIHGYKMCRAYGSQRSPPKRAVGSEHFVGMEFIPSIFVGCNLFRHFLV